MFLCRQLIDFGISSVNLCRSTHLVSDIWLRCFVFEFIWARWQSTKFVGFCNSSEGGHRRRRHWHTRCRFFRLFHRYRIWNIVCAVWTVCRWYITTWEMHLSTNDSVTLFILNGVHWPHFGGRSKHGALYRSPNWLRHKRYHRKFLFRSIYTFMNVLYDMKIYAFWHPGAARCFKLLIFVFSHF